MANFQVCSRDTDGQFTVVRTVAGTAQYDHGIFISDDGEYVISSGSRANGVAVYRWDGVEYSPIQTIPTLSNVYITPPSTLKSLVE